MKKGGKHHISIHAPREGSDFSDVPTFSDKGISIHAPREGSDRSGVGYWYSPSLFLSTLPARGATEAQEVLNIVHPISIHAPREGSDEQGLEAIERRKNFYPRSPRGERQSVLCRNISLTYFYPRSPRGERRDTG